MYKKYYNSGHQQGASPSMEVNIYQESMEINDDILSVLLICQIDFMLIGLRCQH